MTRHPLTILFSGMMAGDPGQGGATWAILQHVLGLRRLGHEVLFVEPIKPSSVRPNTIDFAASDNAVYFRNVVESFGLDGRAALLLDDGSRRTVGLPYEALVQVARRADVHVNVSGMLTEPALVEPIPTRVYLDLDPAFIQMWHAVQGVDMRFDGHTHFVTVGQAIGEPGCPVPTCGREWIKTFQPVVLDRWTLADGPREWDAWTTIANWRGYGSIEHDGVLYGQKAHSLRRLFDLPGRTREPLLLALAIHPNETRDVAALAEHGWRWIDPATVAASPSAYQQFVRGSKGEFGVAKSGYVESRCGWFSDRSACYLASGRPVVAQEAGFSAFLPVGDGLRAFRDADEAAAHLEAIAGDYDRHRRAARRLAETYFDSDRVLARLLEQIGARSCT